MAIHESNCLINADRECGYCTCGADAAENRELYIAELMKVAAAARAAIVVKVDWTNAEARDLWETLRLSVREMDRKFV
jgi:hypothetical protein